MASPSSTTVCRARHTVVDEGDAITDKDFVFDRHRFADEGMRGNLAAPADARIFLNLDESANPGAVADFAAVEIYEVVNGDIAPQLNVGRDDTELTGHE